MKAEMKKLKRERTIGRKAHTSRGRKRRQYRPFPYERVAKMWTKGMTLARIAVAIDRVDKDNPQDPYHSLRNFLHRMHRGYPNGKGRIVKLPHRVSQATVRASRKAGLRAW
jgi:hypothetical protein